MKRSHRISIAAFALAWSGLAGAAEILVNTFLESRPFAGLEVRLDGRSLGVSGSQGDAAGPLTAGAHQLQVFKRGAKLAEYAFTVRDAQNAEISITFTDFDTPPVITLDTYGADDIGGLGSPGRVSGTITDAAGEPVAGATISIDGSGAETTSNLDGSFALSAARGRYTLRVTHPEHETVTRESFRVIANVGVAANVTLPPRSIDTAAAVDSAPATELDEVVVLGTYKPLGGLQGAVEQERFSSAITDAISIDEILRAGDSDVALALKRLVGVSVTGGRYAVVRGLNGRYISATLNGALMPSTDPFRRDVQLDLFPSGILSGIEIQKTFSADLPGDTTGGIIRIDTRSMPEDPIHRLSLSMGYVSGVTGEHIASYDGGDTDWLGFDDGTRELPASLRASSNDGLDFSVCQVEGQQNCVSREEAAALAGQLPNVYNARPLDASHDFGLAYGVGDRYELRAGTLGVYGAASYGRNTDSRQDAFVNDVYSNNGNGGLRSARYTKDTIDTTLNAYLAAGLQGNGGWEVLSKSTLLRDTEDITTLENGTNGEELPLTRTTLDRVERQFVSQQLQGKHLLFGGSDEASWRLGASQTRRLSPDRRTYNYLGGSLSPFTVERAYSELTEDGLDLGLDYATPLMITAVTRMKIKAGLLANERSRDQELVRIGVRTGSNSDVDYTQDAETLLSATNFENDAFRLAGRSTDTDSYAAEQQSAAGYLSTETNLSETVTVLAGVRQDNYTIDLRFPNSTLVEPVRFASSELLPTVGAIYRPFEGVQLRAGYSATVSRPNITELAPSRFYDENDREFVGCPTCEESTVDNFDIRAEYYAGEDTNVSLALFTKEIASPLEVSIADASGSSSTALTFRNNLGATVSGLEIDGNTAVPFGGAFSLSLGGNLSLIRSEIRLDDVGRRLEIDPSRELQGQSPVLANLQVGLAHFPWSQRLTLAVNYFDDRIDRVTRNVPSVYESGRASVNLNYEKDFVSGSTLRLKLGNLLDEQTEYTQGGQVIESYRRGREFLLTYSLDLEP